MSKRVLPIEKLLHWAYAEQRVHLNVEGYGGDLDVEGDSDGPRFCLAAVGDHSHPDAMTLDRLVSGLSHDTRGLVRKHGVAGTRPDWKPAARHRMEPRMWDLHLTSARRWAVHLKTLKAPDSRYPQNLVLVNTSGNFDYCEIIEVDAPDMVATLRAFYRDWIVGLSALRDAITAHGDSLIDYDVNDVLPAFEPWRGQATHRILFAEKRSLTTE